MHIEVKKGYSIVVYKTDCWTKDLSRSLFASTQMTKNQESYLTQTGLTFHQIDDKHVRGYCLTLTKHSINFDTIGTA